MNGVAALRVAPHVGGGNIAGHVFEQIDSGLVKFRDDLRRMLGFFFCVRPRDQVRRNDETQSFRTDARTVGDNEIAKPEQRFIFFPRGDVQERIGADDEKKAIAVAVVDVPEVAHGIHGILELCAAEILAGFGKRGNEVRMLRAGQRDHGKAVRERREVLLQLVRRPARGNEVELIEIEASVGGAGHGKMAVVNGIERTAEKSDAARMMFGGGAVRLRGGQ